MNDRTFSRILASEENASTTTQAWQSLLPPPPTHTHTHTISEWRSLQAKVGLIRNTTEQIFNLRILYEKYLQHQQDLYHVFIDFKKAFNRVLHAALWAALKKYNISTNLNRVIKHLYDKATNAVLFNSGIGDWFQRTVGV